MFDDEQSLHSNGEKPDFIAKAKTWQMMKGREAVGGIPCQHRAAVRLINSLGRQLSNAVPPAQTAETKWMI